MKDKIAGSCLCGKVTYTASGKPRNIIACHCSQCRKFSGHYTAATSVSPESLVIKGEDSLKWYQSFSNAEMGFCEHCGSSLFFKPDSGDRISIFAGTIDGDTELSLTSHIFCEEKGDYYELQDEAEQFSTGGAKLELPR